MTDNELLARIDERTSRIMETLEKINNRLHDVETTEMTCEARTTNLPDRVHILEIEHERQQGMISTVKILAGGSVLAFVTAILSILKVLGIV